MYIYIYIYIKLFFLECPEVPRAMRDDLLRMTIVSCKAVSNLLATAKTSPKPLPALSNPMWNLNLQNPSRVSVVSFRMASSAATFPSRLAHSGSCSPTPLSLDLGVMKPSEYCQTRLRGFTRLDAQLGNHDQEAARN